MAILRTDKNCTEAVRENHYPTVKQFTATITYKSMLTTTKCLPVFSFPQSKTLPAAKQTIKFEIIKCDAINYDYSHK